MREQLLEVQSTIVGYGPEKSKGNYKVGRTLIKIFQFWPFIFCLILMFCLLFLLYFVKGGNGMCKVYDPLPEFYWEGNAKKFLLQPLDTKMFIRRGGAIENLHTKLHWNQTSLGVHPGNAGYVLLFGHYISVREDF